jgi:hypothetical protein
VSSYFTCSLSVFSELLLSKLDKGISEPFIKQSDKVKLSQNKNVVCSYFCFWKKSIDDINHIGGVMVSVLASSVVDRGFWWCNG